MTNNNKDTIEELVAQTEHVTSKVRNDIEKIFGIFSAPQFCRYCDQTENGPNHELKSAGSLKEYKFVVSVNKPFEIEGKIFLTIRGDQYGLRTEGLLWVRSILTDDEYSKYEQFVKNNMRSVQVSKPNGPFEIVERKMPEPGDAKFNSSHSSHCRIHHIPVMVVSQLYHLHHLPSF